MRTPLVTCTRTTRSGGGWRYTIFGPMGPLVSLWGSGSIANLQRDAEAALAKLPVSAADASGPMGERP